MKFLFQEKRPKPKQSSLFFIIKVGFSVWFFHIKHAFCWENKRHFYEQSASQKNVVAAKPIVCLFGCLILPVFTEINGTCRLLELGVSTFACR